MSEEDLELLITLDDPVDLPEEDTFNHFKPTDFEDKVTFGQGALTNTKGITVNEMLFAFI